MHFNWNDLMKIIESMTEDQRDMDVSVYDQEADEYYCVEGVGFSEDDDVLCKDDAYIIFPLNSDVEAIRKENS